MLTEKEIGYLREELANAQNPLFFYDDDPDGVCSFLLVYRMHREGTGIIVKLAPKLDVRFSHKIKEQNPDKIFVLDIPMVDQEFIDDAKRPMFWIDHHGPYARNNIRYYNPRIKDPEAYIPTSRMTYQLREKGEDLWIATVGCLADWHMPDFIDEFIKKYPHLLPKKIDLPDAVYKQPIGKLIRIFSFLLKGQMPEVRRSIKILTRITSPDEILNQETSQGRFLYKRYEKINEEYVKILKEARKCASSSKLFLFNYQGGKISFTTDLANELVNTYPKKVIIIARNKSGEMKCSIRAKENIREAVEKSLEGVEGYGGGHEKACGAVIKEKDWDRFLETFKREIK